MAGKPRKKPARAKREKAGRPALVGSEVQLAICEWIAQGHALAGYCRQYGLGYSTVQAALKASPVFQDNYTRARLDSADADADMVADLRARCLTGEISPEQARVAIDACKWCAGKRQPKVYGDKLDLNHAGELTLKHVTLDELRKRLAEGKPEREE